MPKLPLSVAVNAWLLQENHCSGWMIQYNDYINKFCKDIILTQIFVFQVVETLKIKYPEFYFLEIKHGVLISKNTNNFDIFTTNSSKQLMTC